jgi:glycosyltransferase involved in cell wall biosynthesis
MNGSVASDASAPGAPTWVITAPAPAGVFDGIGDYASRLAAALGSTHRMCLVVSGRDPLPSPDQVAGVLHQYSPHARSPQLYEWLQSVHARRVPIVVTVHEYWPPASWSPRRAMLRWQNRRRLVALLRLATAVVVTQDIYSRELQAAGLLEGKAVHVIPVGSNISRAGVSAPRDGGLVLFGQPASFERTHLAALAAWMAEDSVRPRLTWVGRSLDELQRAWHDVAPAGSDAVTFVGGADEAVVSAQLLRATVGLAPYSNGASGKRTTLAALLQHGVPTVVTAGIATDAWLTTSHGVVAVSGDDPRAFLDAVDTLLQDSGARARLSSGAETLFSTRLAWPRLAAQYGVVMHDASHREKDRDAR